MEEILSWNGLFGEARLRGFRLQSLREDEHGYFHACWRDATTVYKIVDRRAPFTAAHDAFFAAVAAAKGEAAPVEPQTDLFEQGGGNDAHSTVGKSETDLFG